MRALVLFVISHYAIHGNPINPQIIHGAAEFIHSPQMIEIIANDGSVIDWESFSIDADEVFRFILPSASSTVLNRVMESNPSRLMGILESNGRILLMNPHGILVGQDAQINTASFLASTLDIAIHSFRENNELLFTGTSKGSLMNEGSIHALEGDLFLIGHTVLNKGSLYAKNGSVGLLAGREAQIKTTGLDRIYVRGDSLSKAFIHPDHIEASNVSQSIHQGVITSGTVYLLGDQVILRAGSKIDGSGDYEGGNVWIGGKTTHYSWVEQGAVIDASAKVRGNGGEIIVWGDKGTGFYGNALAMAGPFGGDGGFIEISGSYLDYQGSVSTFAPAGNTGMLLLDPMDITISFAGNFLVSPGPFFTPLSGVCDSLPGFSNLSTGSIMADLLGSNVTVDTTGMPGGCPGDILVDPSGIIIWATGFDLTLQAGRNITILARIQNTLAVGGGDVTLIAGVLTSGTIAIGPSTVPVSVGSLSGMTTVNAPNADLRIESGTGSNSSQLGFSVPSGAFFPTPVTGPISVVCRDLFMRGSSFPIGPASAVIGHGFFNTGLTTGFNTMSSATINVTASGNITMLSGLGSFSEALIGHGAIALFNFGGALTIEGDITVDCRGNLTQQIEAADLTASGIGHGCHAGGRADPFTLSGNISVTAQQGISLLLPPVVMNLDCYIGHSLNLFAFTGAEVITMNGDIDVHSGGTLLLGGNTNVLGRVRIGHTVFSGNALFIPSTVTSDIRVSACQDIRMEANASQYCFIGANERWANITETVSVVAGRDLILQDTLPSFPPVTGGARIGVIAPTTSAGVKNSHTFVAAGGNISFAARTPVMPPQVIDAYGNVIVTAGGNITVPPSNNFIGTEVLNGGFLTRIYAGGNIIGQNFGAGNAPTGVPLNHSLEVRAGGDIQLSTGFTTTTGSIILEADTQLGAGALWTNSGAAITSIGGGATGPINTSFCGAPISTNSSPISANGIGCFNVPVANITLQTTDGDITVNSGALSALGLGNCNISFGTGLGDTVLLVTINGDITVYASARSPCVRSSFHDVRINQLIMTSGTVLISANNDLHITSMGSIITTSPVTLICDNQAPVRPLIGSGRFIMDTGSVVDSGAAPLRIYTAQQNLNMINGTLNTVFPFMPGTFFVDTNQERWCVYYCESLPGSPFTISYKYCLQQATQQATVIIDQFLVDLHPYDEYLGWAQIFWLLGKKKDHPFSVPHYLRRRHLDIINHPKTWMQMTGGPWSSLTNSNYSE